MYSDYLVFADESGDHGLKNLQYPVFVLSFCLFEKSSYVEHVVPAVLNLKLKWWGHDAVVLHSSEIKRQENDFGFLNREEFRLEFMNDVAELIADVPFVLISAAIRKKDLLNSYVTPIDPYSLALLFCMERTQMFLSSRSQVESETVILVEERGKNEDTALRKVFDTIRDGDNQVGKMPNMRMRFCNKKANSSGLQIADLVSTPIGRHLLNPNQDNRAYQVVKSKFRKSPYGDIRGWGLKCFPG